MTCVNKTTQERLRDLEALNPLTVLAVGKRGASGSKPAEMPHERSFEFFMVCEKVRTALRMLPCRIRKQTPPRPQQVGSVGACAEETEAGSAATRHVELVLPLQFVTSHDLLALQFDDIVAGTNVVLCAMTVLRAGDASTGSISVASLGPPKNVLELKPPSARFRKQVASQLLASDSKGQAKKKDEGGKSGIDDDVGFDSGMESHMEAAEVADVHGAAAADDIALEGLNLILEEAEAEADESQETAPATDVDGGDGDGEPVSAAANMLEAIIFEHANDLAEELASQEKELMQEARMEAEEAQCDELEANIVKCVVASRSSASSACTSVNAKHIEETFEASAGQLCLEECVQEAILADRSILGNEDGLLPAADALPSRSSNAAGASARWSSWAEQSYAVQLKLVAVTCSHL